MVAARDGDRRALERLLALYEPAILRFSSRLCRDPEDAQDVLQDSLLAMARTVKDFRGASSVSTWAYAIARSFCLKRRRRGKSALSGERPIEAEPESSLPATEDAGPEESLARKELGAALETAIRALEPKYREVLLLRDVEGLSAPEVGEVLGIGIPAIKSRLHRARLAVREQLAPLLEPPELRRRDPGCPDIARLLSRHLEGEIGPESCAAMERHLEGCEVCRATCDSLRASLALCKSLPAAPVPPELERTIRASVRRLVGEPTAQGG